MGEPAAKEGDNILGSDTHIIMLPSGQGAVPTPLPNPFHGIIQDACSPNVRIMGKAAATVGSKAINTPPHAPAGGPFQSPPTNEGTIQTGSATVRINGKPAARHGDRALTCNDPAPMPIGTVVATGTVRIG